MRMVRAGRTRAIIAHVITNVAPDPTTVVVFGGSYSGRGSMRGDTGGGPSPVKALRRAIARERLLVVVDEFRTTATHSECHQPLVAKANDPTGREKYCPTCDKDVPRDVDAGISIDSVWVGIARDGERPAHLRRGG